MKHFFIILGLLLCYSTNSYGQFWKKKDGTASAKSGSYNAPKNKDSFRGKNKKGPNVNSPGNPNSSSKSRFYQSFSSKKNIKFKHNSEFSSSKRRYKSTIAKPKNSNKDGSQTSSGGRKSGKGRKKEK